MHFRGGLSNPDFCGDLLVQPACAYQTHHLPLARAERVVTLAQIMGLRVGIVPDQIAIQRNLHSIKQILFPHRL